MRKSGKSVLSALKSRSGSILRRIVPGRKSEAENSPPAEEKETGKSANTRNVVELPATNGFHQRNGKPILNGQCRNSQPEQADLVRQLRRSWYCHIKLISDVALSLLILLFAAPVILLAMLLVKLTSRGPALYSQIRVGMDGKPFTIYKIRSMTDQCENLTGAEWCQPGDSRITPVGRLLRKTHIDELPQLWNVLRGEMSLIGPRPERPEFVPQLDKAIPLYTVRLLVRPGLSGLAQVQLPPDTNLQSVRLKLAYDIYYIRNLHLLMDFRIMISTGLKLLHMPFSWIRNVCRYAAADVIKSEYDVLVQAGKCTAR